MRSEELDEYLALSYPYELIPDEAGGFVAHHPDLDGCMAQGETAEEVIRNLDRAREMWIQCRLEDGLPVPRPLDEEPSGRLTVRLPRYLHGQLVREARRQEVSLNQLVSTVLAQHTGAPTQVEHAASRLTGLVAELAEMMQRRGEDESAAAPSSRIAGGGPSAALWSTVTQRALGWREGTAIHRAAQALFRQGTPEARTLARELLHLLPEIRMSDFMLALLFLSSPEPAADDAEARERWAADLRQGWDCAADAFRLGLSYDEASIVARCIPDFHIEMLWPQLTYAVTLVSDHSRNDSMAKVAAWVAREKNDVDRAKRYDSIAQSVHSVH